MGNNCWLAPCMLCHLPHYKARHIWRRLITERITLYNAYVVGFLVTSNFLQWKLWTGVRIFFQLQDLKNHASFICPRWSRRHVRLENVAELLTETWTFVKERVQGCAMKVGEVSCLRAIVIVFKDTLRSIHIFIYKINKNFTRPIFYPLIRVYTNGRAITLGCPNCSLIVFKAVEYIIRPVLDVEFLTRWMQFKQ